MDELWADISDPMDVYNVNLKLGQLVETSLMQYEMVVNSTNEAECHQWVCDSDLNIISISMAVRIKHTRQSKRQLALWRGHVSWLNMHAARNINYKLSKWLEYVTCAHCCSREHTILFCFSYFAVIDHQEIVPFDRRRMLSIASNRPIDASGGSAFLPFGLLF